MSSRNNNGSNINPNTNTNIYSDQQEPAVSKDELIRELLQVCQTRGVDVPPGLLARIHTAEEPGQTPLLTHQRDRRRSTHYLQQQCQKRQQQDQELDASHDDDMEHIMRLMHSLGEGRNRFELRLHDASYVTSRKETHDLSSSSGNARVTDASDAFDIEGQNVSHSTAGSSMHSPNNVQISNILNSSPIYKLVAGITSCWRGVSQSTIINRNEILSGVNLRFTSGTSYLVLGAPSSGKSLLLKYIANLLRSDSHRKLGGKVTLNGKRPIRTDICWPSLVAYTDQIDRLHPMLTVYETLRFAFDCRAAGTHHKSYYNDNAETDDLIAKMDQEEFRINNILKNFGMDRVKDTYVGDDSKVRGVSGGERKRVTVCETITYSAPVMCLDEISTGLDAATTYDIVKLLTRVTRFMHIIPIVTLLQPPPEVVALFDELILLDCGRLIYSGKVEDAVGYFESLGYFLPERMDVAEWMQSLPTADGAKFLRNSSKDQGAGHRRHLSSAEFADAFQKSQLGRKIAIEIKKPLEHQVYGFIKAKEFSEKYRNPWYKAIWLVFRRELLLWRRDTYNLRAKVAQDIVMGVIVGTVFWQTPASSAIFGVLFQTLLMMTLGAMLATPQQVDKRSIFYKHQDGNFFPTWTFVVGRSLSQLPQAFIDSMLYGTIVYFFVGLSYSNGATIANYFVFELLILATTYGTTLIFAVFSSALRDKAACQAGMAVLLVIMVIFSGFTVQPDVIPNYLQWIYWANFFAWLLKGLAINEFQSGAYDNINPLSGETMGDTILDRFGFSMNGEALQYEWVWYSLAFAAVVGLISIIASTFFLANVRYESGKPADSPSSPTKTNDGGTGGGSVTNAEIAFDESFDLPFKKTSLTWKGICYTVKASTSNESITLLNGVDGYILPGKMTALMGSSGAGKTTLMEVLALRKTNGEIQGEIRVNGHLQEKNSFRRCTGFVQQFDVQSPQLTVLETVQFSAKLRLAEDDPNNTKENVDRFIRKVLRMLELIPIQHSVVGDDVTGGLSFEQRKRLSIAVELVANPSIIFLDEPTSGLSARAASVVMRGLHRIAATGRAVCATIHQPSQAIFNSFDSLLLLKRGGHVVYFGDLGSESSDLIRYLERFDSTERIQKGENAATWMLRVISDSSSNDGESYDYAQAYAKSIDRKRCLARIAAIQRNATNQNKLMYSSKYATSTRTQSRAVFKRLMTIYWRSPSYNLLRVLVSVVVALIMGLIFITQRVPSTEGDMNSRITSIFVTTVFLGISSFNSVLALFELERNMFYRHKSALMYKSSSINAAFSFAEIPFIIWASVAFVVVFYFMIGFSPEAAKFFTYLLFFALTLATFTYLGQMLTALLRDAETAQLLGSAVAGMSALFCGILIKPQFISSFWVFMYWVTPLHWVLEALITSQYHLDESPIMASPGSPFNLALIAKGDCAQESFGPCYGTADQWVEITFGGWFQYDNVWRADLPYLLGICLLSRVVCYVALTKLNYLRR